MNVKRKGTLPSEDSTIFNKRALRTFAPCSSSCQSGGKSIRLAEKACEKRVNMLLGEKRLMQEH